MQKLNTQNFSASQQPIDCQRLDSLKSIESPRAQSSTKLKETPASEHVIQFPLKAKPDFLRKGCTHNFTTKQLMNISPWKTTCSLSYIPSPANSPFPIPGALNQTTRTKPSSQANIHTKPPSTHHSSTLPQPREPECTLLLASLTRKHTQ